MERKLAAIVFADVHGYSRLMGEAEEATIRALLAHRKTIEGLVERHHGRFVNSAGDSILAEFGSVLNAIGCALEIQATLRAENATLPSERRMEFRIGVNVGDVVVEGEHIYGDGVNVAARLESLAEPGGICISGNVHEQIRNKLTLGYHDLGWQTVKNIAEPVRVFRVLPQPSSPATTDIHTVQRKYVRWGGLSMGAFAIFGATILLVQHISFRPPPTSGSPPPAENTALALPDKPSIAVLPFANLSNDPQQEYFSDGLTDDLITDLSRLPGLFVIARASTFSYKGKSVDPEHVGRELGVRYLLEGSARKADGLVRVNVQLADATTGAELWAQRYDRELSDIFKVQDQIVQSLTTSLGVELAQLQNRPRTKNLDAYDSYLQGFELSLRGERADIATARKMIKNAIALDPNYADAYASLGMLDYLQFVQQWNMDPHAVDTAEDSARKALSLDKNNAVAYITLGRIASLKNQFEEATTDIKQAIKLDPNSALAYDCLSQTDNLVVKPEEALANAQIAMRLDPKHQEVSNQFVGWAYNEMGRYREALEALKKGPDIPFNRTDRVYAYTELGQEQDARNEAKEVLRLAPNFSVKSLEERHPPKAEFWRRYYSDLRKAGLN